MKIVLVIAYLSMFGDVRIERHDRTDWNECRKEATAYFNKVRVGTARAWCAKVVERNRHGN